MSFQLFHFCTVKIWLFFAFYLKHTKKNTSNILDLMTLNQNPQLINLVNISQIYDSSKSRNTATTIVMSKIVCLNKYIEFINMRDD